MKDPTRQPGFAFTDVRLARAQYELKSDPTSEAEAELQWRYEDSVDIQGGTVVVKQDLMARLVDRHRRDLVYLTARVAVEGRFEGSPDSNLNPSEFGEGHAPAILFAFTREWMHRLTSNAGTWPAILIPPVNVLELRRKRREASN